MGILKWDPKDPNEVLDYLLDWAELHLAVDEAILTSTWIIAPSGLTQDADSHTDGATTIWLSGGTLGTTYSLTNRITTDGSRTMDQTVRLKVKAK